MIASVRGVVVLACIAFALLLVAVLDHPARQLVVDRALVPSFVAERVTGIVFERPGRPEMRITRIGSSWQLASAAADPMTIDGVLTALRGARWHRRAPKARAGTPRATVRVIAGAHVTTLAIGEALGEQVWIAQGEHAFLVDSWVATALSPEPLALVIRHPLADAANAKQVTIRAAGSEPHRITGRHQREPNELWLDPMIIDAFYDACAELEIVELSPPAPPQLPAIELDGAIVQFAGTCADNRVRITGTRASGCVERAAWEKLAAALGKLSQPASSNADPRPLPITPVTIAAGEVTIDLRRDVDPERARELVTALTTRVESIATVPNGSPRSTLVAGDGSTQIVLELYDHVLVRKGELAALKPTRDAWRIITRPLTELADPTLWREDPVTITTLTLDDIQYTRGAVLGEWTRLPIGAIDPALVDVLVEALATVRAPRGARPAQIAHRLQFTVTPPAGKPITHALEIGPTTGEGCRARVDAAPVTLPLALCTVTAALAAKR